MSASPPNGPARKLARTLLKPLDGRIADINRRVGAATASASEAGERVEELAREVGAYTATTTESNTFIGRELRRVDESLDALQERVRLLTDRDYNERLNAVASASLDRLDGAVAGLINHATGHRGFAAQAGLWFNPPVNVELGEQQRADRGCQRADRRDRLGVRRPVAHRAAGPRARGRQRREHVRAVGSVARLPRDGARPARAPLRPPEPGRP